MSDDLFELVAAHGPQALFVILLANCLGIPFPTSLLLLALGSFARQGEMPLLPFLAASLAGALAGNQLGYLLGRLGGNLLVARLEQRPRAAAAMERAERLVWRWSGPGIYFSRWLLAPLGPWMNLATGIARYPWPRFLLWDFLGLTTWIGLYSMLGFFFSGSVQRLAELIGSLTWLLVFILITLLLGWLLFRRWRATMVARLEDGAADAGKPGSSR